MTLARPDFLPVVLGGDIGAYSLARSFHEAYGTQALVASTRRCHLCGDSTILDNVIMPELEDPAAFVDALLRLAEGRDERLLLLACGDWYVRLIVEHRAQLEGRFVIPYVDHALLDRLTEKDRFYDLCAEVGVPCPRTVAHDPAEPLDAGALPFGFPLVAKPASSAAYHWARFAGKRKVFFPADADELAEVLRGAREGGYRGKMLLQELLPGDDSQMRILTTYSDQAGKVRMAAFGQTLLEDRRPFGIGNPVAIVSRVDERVIDDARRLLEAVGYTGFANFDVRVDPRDGSHRFLEVNTRLGRSSYYVTAAGQNVARWLVGDLLGDGALPAGLTVARGESLYAVVPRDVLLREVADPALRAEVRRLYAAGRACDPLAYRAERRLRRRLYPLAARWRQRRAFRDAARRLAPNPATRAGGGARREAVPAEAAAERAGALA